MATKSSVLTPTKIGSTGPVKGGMGSAHGPHFPFLPGQGSYGNANVGRRSVGEGKSSTGAGKGNIPFLPNKPKGSKVVGS